MKTILLAAVISVLGTSCVLGMDLPNPIHASCKIEWTFGLNCKNVSVKVIDQIRKWNGTDCQSGEKCRYTFKSFDGTTLKAHHTTPVHFYTDDLTMTFKASGTNCAVSGFSTSETWYAVLDYGTNYCNLHNLITGSELDKTAGYSEKTDDSDCTQYSSANCEKY